MKLNRWFLSKYHLIEKETTLKTDDILIHTQIPTYTEQPSQFILE